VCISLVYVAKWLLIYMLRHFHCLLQCSIRSQIYLVHIRALTSPYRINTNTCTHTLSKHHFINTMSLRNVSALKGPSTRNTVDNTSTERPTKRFTRCKIQLSEQRVVCNAAATQLRYQRTDALYQIHVHSKDTTPICFVQNIQYPDFNP
jgi:hypothetical protein